ncbi:MAG TPA: class I SAM-dependent methyltransferase, partial [Phycisphaerae bacterium]|nr:class I SAM-dependent methyltransferase [Phycisphaerae bacterium]
MVETTSHRPFASAGALCAAMLAAGAALASDPANCRAAEADLARQVLEATGLKGGLIVHPNCGDGRLTAALRAGEGFLVHGLDTDAANVRRARQYLRQRGGYGPVSVERYDGRHLPYADGLVNLLVAERLGDVPPAEALRVLAPGGSLYTKQDGRWQRTVKPRPANTDEWTHFLHDAGGNPVSRDAVVGPPGRVQWIADPRHARSHEHAPSTQALVSSGGRIFYLADEGAIDSLRQPARWHLVARDAYNGLRLWQRSFDPWYPHIVNWGTVPSQLQRRLVAVGDRVYVTLGLFAPVSVVDAATGQTLKVYERTEGTEEILCHDGTVLLATRQVTDERVGGLERWLRMERQRKSPLYVRETAEPLLKEFRGTQGRGPKAVVA